MDKSPSSKSSLFLSLVLLITISFIVISCSQELKNDDVETQAPLPPRIDVFAKKIAVIPVRFSDTPANYLAMQPSKKEIKQTIFEGRIKKFFDDISYGKFTYSGVVYDYVTSSMKGLVGDGPVEGLAIEANVNLIIPDFDAQDYDGLAILPINDAGLALAYANRTVLTINGEKARTHFIMVPVHIGKYGRVASNVFQNTFTNTEYDKEIATAEVIPPEFSIPNVLTEFEIIFSHEFLHFLGIGDHALSRTNGSKPAYEPEIANNGQLLSFDYGSKFDVMGYATYASSVNTVYRNFLGWIDEDKKGTIATKDTQTFTIFPLNNQDADKKTAVEIRIPGKTASPLYSDIGRGMYRSNFNNQGYFLEVRNRNDGTLKWDARLADVNVSENEKGLFIQKTDGYAAFLLDASPSPNIDYTLTGGNGIVPDLRDVVLKPSMKYEDDYVKIYDVIANSDGSFTVTVEVK